MRVKAIKKNKALIPIEIPRIINKSCHIIKLYIDLAFKYYYVSLKQTFASLVELVKEIFRISLNMLNISPVIDQFNYLDRDFSLRSLANETKTKKHT